MKEATATLGEGIYLTEVVVDPRRQFGQPVVNNTNIKAETIYNLFEGGESTESIEDLYNLSKKQVKDVITFFKNSN